MSLSDADLDRIRAALADDPTLLAQIVGSARRDVLSELERSRLEPAVVTAVRSRDNGFPALSVLVDGDSTDNPTPVNPLSFKHPSDLAVGERVLVMFDPPNAPYYIGSIGDRGGEGYGKPYATRVVAASDSVATNWRAADWVCDGTADDVEIQAAIDSITDEGVGGKVVLLEGSYYCNPGITVPGSSGPPRQQVVHLQGMGEGTMLWFSDAGTGLTVTGGWVTDLTLVLNDPDEVSTGGALIGIEASDDAVLDRLVLDEESGGSA